MPGILYTDGTFEARGVPPGKHFVVTGLSNVMAAGVIVGDTDVEGLELEPIALLPRGGFPGYTVDNRVPGTKPRLATIRGRLISEATGQPMSAILQVKGWSQVSFPIGADGRFEVPKLLPGSYLLEVSAFDHYTFNENVVVGEEDINLEFRVKRVY